MVQMNSQNGSLAVTAPWLHPATHTHTLSCAHTHTHTHVHSCTHTQSHAHRRTHSHTYRHKHTLSCTHIQAQTHTLMHTHTHTHTHGCIFFYCLVFTFFSTTRRHTHTHTHTRLLMNINKHNIMINDMQMFLFTLIHWSLCLPVCVTVVYLTFLFKPLLQVCMTSVLIPVAAF